MSEVLFLLPLINYSAVEGLVFVEIESGEYPEMDSADIMSFAAQAPGSRSLTTYLALLPEGYAVIRDALARAATAGEV